MTTIIDNLAWAITNVVTGLDGNNLDLVEFVVYVNAFDSIRNTIITTLIIAANVLATALVATIIVKLNRKKVFI